MLGTMITYRAKYPCGYGSARRARIFIIAFALRCGFDEAQLIDIESAVGEAVANAAEHGDGTVDAGFDIMASFDGARLTIEVKDYGAGFDSDAALAACPDTSAGRGYGIFLMRELMDELVYSDRGTRIRLVKQRPHEQRILHAV
jgi:anti-sigma regulatory factor (Ser/Thr protein kinase)